MIGLLYLRWYYFYICICNSICICIVVWLLMILMLYCRQSRCTGSPCKTPSWSRIHGFNLPNTFIPPSSYFISLDLQLSPWEGFLVHILYFPQVLWRRARWRNMSKQVNFRVTPGASVHYSLVTNTNTKYKWPEDDGDLKSVSILKTLTWIMRRDISRINSLWHSWPGLSQRGTDGIQIQAPRPIQQQSLWRNFVCINIQYSPEFLDFLVKMKFCHKNQYLYQVHLEAC